MVLRSDQRLAASIQQRSRGAPHYPASMPAYPIWPRGCRRMQWAAKDRFRGRVTEAWRRQRAGPAFRTPTMRASAAPLIGPVGQDGGPGVPARAADGMQGNQRQPHLRAAAPADTGRCSGAGQRLMRIAGSAIRPTSSTIARMVSTTRSGCARAMSAKDSALPSRSACACSARTRNARARW